VSDDELLMRYVAGGDDVDAMRAAGAPKEYAEGNKPLLVLLEELARRRGFAHIQIAKGGLRLALQKRARPAQ
jgi:hypothetical protein